MPGHLTPAAVRRQIEAGTIEPLYLVTGDDEVAMSGIASALAESVEEDFRSFNVQRFYANDQGSTLAAVLDAAATLPLLAPRRVVILHQAERVLSARKAKAADTGEAGEEEGGAEGEGRTSPVALLKAYAKRPHLHAAVALIGVGLGRAFDALADQATVVTCEASADVIRTLEAEHGVRFDRDAAELLRQLAGADLARLRADVERVLLYAAGRTVIGRDQVREVIATASSAGGKKLWVDVANRRAAAALAELDLELAEGAVPYMILGLVRTVVERTVAPRDLPRAIEALLRTDLALKTSGGDPRVLLERLIVEVCETGKA